MICRRVGASLCKANIVKGSDKGTKPLRLLLIKVRWFLYILSSVALIPLSMTHYTDLRDQS